VACRPSLQGRCKALTTVIVGAGLAGLAAAQRLAEKNHRAIVLEGRDRIGGRVYTERDRMQSFPMELGAEWYEKKGPIDRILRKSGGESTESEGQRVEPVGDSWDEVEDRFSNNESLLRRIKLRENEDVSLDDALREYGDDPSLAGARATLSTYVEGFHAARTDRISVRWLQEVEKNHPASSADRRSVDGLHTAVELLASGVRAHGEIRLSTIVREIHWSRGHVRLDTDNGTSVECTAAIITIPVALLKTSASRAAPKFFPSLTEKEAAAGLLEMGQASKVVLRFRTPFWRRNVELREASFLHAFEQPFPTWWTPEYPEWPFLVAWAGGPQSERLGRATNETSEGIRSAGSDGLLDLAISSLARMLHTTRAEIERELEEHYYHDWNNDPFALGAYSYVAVGGARAHEDLGRPVADTLFFAGEATCGEGQNATMEGAVISGWRAADELLESVLHK
jgi:monoamine oxidase